MGKFAQDTKANGNLYNEDGYLVMQPGPDEGYIIHGSKDCRYIVPIYILTCRWSGGEAFGTLSIISQTNKYIHWDVISQLSKNVGQVAFEVLCSFLII